MLTRVLILLITIISILACKPDKPAHKKKMIETTPANSVFWEMNGERMQLNRMGGSFGMTRNGNNLVVFSTDGEQGLVLSVTVDSTADFIGRHPLIGRRTRIEAAPRDSWIRYNKKLNEKDVSYISKFCKPTEGYIEITHFDSTRRQVSGTFEGVVCAAGIHGEGVEPLRIEKGVFEKLRISRLQ